MATVSGMGTTFNLPNYTGELYSISPFETPFLSAIGGLSGGESTLTTEFEWQTEDLEATSANNSRVEGADAPNPTEVSRSNVTNVVEIHQEAITLSYTRMATPALHAGVNNEAVNPIRDELTHQVMLKLRKIAVDVEKSFLTGTYVKPANNATARQTRGIFPAITTNVLANGGTGRALTVDLMNTLFRTTFDNGAPLDQNTVLLVGSAAKVKLSNLYATAFGGSTPPSRNVGGVNLQTLVTDFGEFPIMLDRWAPAGTVGLINLGVCRPRHLVIPGKGVLFAEPLAKTGASEKYQLYGEMGLEYGPETYHGKITDVNPAL